MSVAGKYALFWQPREHTELVNTELESGGLQSCQSAKKLQFQGSRVVMTSGQCNAGCHERSMLALM